VAVVRSAAEELAQQELELEAQQARERFDAELNRATQEAKAQAMLAKALESKAQAKLQAQLKKDARAATKRFARMLKQAIAPAPKQPSVWWVPPKPLWRQAVGIVALPITMMLKRVSWVLFLCRLALKL